jgi:hypothetical protein
MICRWLMITRCRQTIGCWCFVRQGSISRSRGTRMPICGATGWSSAAQRRLFATAGRR